jgi:hypothetical protein
LEHPQYGQFFRLIRRISSFHPNSFQPDKLLDARLAACVFSESLCLAAKGSRIWVGHVPRNGLSDRASVRKTDNRVLLRMKESRRQKEHPADHKERGPFRLLRFAHGERECRYGLPIVCSYSKYGHTLARFTDLQSPVTERRGSEFSALLPSRC